MFVTRKAEFSASHLCRIESLSDQENRVLYGEDAHPNGHGHNFIVEVTLEGNINPVTGMVIDLKDLKQILDEEVVQPMDHRFLNYEVEPFQTVVPTAPNVAREIWRRIQRRIDGTGVKLAKVRLFEGGDQYVDVLPGDHAA
jgi:6-pyruvoyltetrahydropterin/6-carboxytetrahydropterin synthase